MNHMVCNVNNMVFNTKDHQYSMLCNCCNIYKNL